jgi:hypothetical protein
LAAFDTRFAALRAPFLAIDANASTSTFGANFATGAHYTITVLAAPPALTCSVAQGFR